MPLPRRPYRDSAILYAILALVIVAFSLATGGGLAKALVVAAVFFLVATGWSWWRFRDKLAQRGRR
jgi:hypothetical protein